MQEMISPKLWDRCQGKIFSVVLKLFSGIPVFI